MCLHITKENDATAIHVDVKHETLDMFVGTLQRKRMPPPYMRKTPELRDVYR